MATNGGTTKLAYKQVAGAFHATRFATETGRQQNLLVTLNLAALAPATSSEEHFFQQVWSRTSRWWSYQRQKGIVSGPFTAYAVHERPDAISRHVHWFLFIPAVLKTPFETALRRRLEKLSGLSCLGRAVHFREVRRPGGVAKYVLKGVDPAYARHFYMCAEPQGEIHGRRLTASRGIGHAARRRAGWKRKRASEA